jgi:hypothetical protein
MGFRKLVKKYLNIEKLHDDERPLFFLEKDSLMKGVIFSGKTPTP